LLQAVDVESLPPQATNGATMIGRNFVAIGSYRQYMRFENSFCNGQMT
jgi:hypothetical protein